MAALLLVLLALIGCDPPPDRPVEAPVERSVDEDSPWASSRSCRACHPAEYESWAASYHRTMTQTASEESILAPWEDERLERHGLTWRLYRDAAGRFMVDMPAFGTDGVGPEERMQRPVVMTTGSHHMQLYWFGAPWNGTKPDPAGVELFQDHCQRCHNPPFPGEYSSDLQNLGIARPVLDEIIADVDHVEAAAGLSPTDRVALLDYVERLQHDDRLFQVPFSWFVREGRWMHEEDTFLQPPDPDADPSGLTEGWSDGCDRCHSVAPEFARDTHDLVGEASVAELGIACEACHGPGRAHADRHRNPVARYAAQLDEIVADDIVNPARLDADRSTQVCGQCHAELVPHDPDAFPGNYRPGDDLTAVTDVVQYMEPPYPLWLRLQLEDAPDLLTSGFWKDGTIRIAGRDYNGLLMTGCHTQGDMSCLSCHTMHGHEPADQLKPEAKGDGACVSCHPAEAAQGTDHTHHAPDSAGSACMNCHMPHTTAGLLTLMRSHRVDSPSAASSARTGRPNACNLCHLDKTLAWTASWTKEWYGAEDLPAGVVSGGEHPAPAAVDWLLRGDAVQRAVVAWHMGWGPAQQASGADWTAPFLAMIVDDPYVAVRYQARRSIRTLPHMDEMDWDNTRDPDELGPIREKVISRWSAQVGPLHRPEVWIHRGEPRWGRLRHLHALRDDTPVAVNE